MRITTLYESGSVQIGEDAQFVNLPVFGVADGHSEVYYPGKEQRNYSFQQGIMLTGGQMAVGCLQRIFNNIELIQRMPLTQLLDETNKNIGAWAENKGASLEDAADLPGASFVVAKIETPELIGLVQGGDCFYVCVDKEETVAASQNLVYPYDIERLRIIAELMEKHNGNRKKMWEEFGPILSRSRRKHVNHDYCVLNGQPRATKLVRYIGLRNIKMLILGTDGFVPYEETKTKTILAEYVLNYYILPNNNDILARLLYSTRRQEKEKKDTSHVDFGEATAIMVEFD